jgi:hypothetical protein
MWHAFVFSHTKQPSQTLMFLSLSVINSVSAPLFSAAALSFLINHSVFPFLGLQHISSIFTLNSSWVIYAKRISIKVFVSGERALQIAK